MAVELDRVSCSLAWMGPARPSLSQISRRRSGNSLGGAGGGGRLRGAREEVDLLDDPRIGLCTTHATVASSNSVQHFGQVGPVRVAGCDETWEGRAICLAYPLQGNTCQKTANLGRPEFIIAASDEYAT